MKGITWINVFLGLWLIFSPFTLGITSTTVFWEEIIIGLLIAGFAFSQGLGKDKKAAGGYSYAIGAFGVWVLFAPFMFGYANITVALWNDVIVGTLVALLAFYQGMKGTPTLPTDHGTHHPSR